MNKKTNNNFLNVVKLLKDGEYHDGTSIGETLQMTRSAVWKVIKKLRGYGIPVEAIRGKGYALLDPLILLDQNYISDAIKPHEVIAFESIDSTNAYLKAMKSAMKVKFCVSEEQTQGRGRFNRAWTSPFGHNLYLSCLYPFKQDVSKLSGLSLVVGLATLATLKKMGLHAGVQLKWPNDVWYHGKKLAGTLIEMQAESHGVCHTVIGTGLNVNMLSDHSTINQPWTSLRQILGQYIDRNQLCVQLIHYLLEYLERFNREGFVDFMEEWEAADALKDKIIEIEHLDKRTIGKACGVTEQGYLKLQQANGHITAISSGNATLTKKTF